MKRGWAAMCDRCGFRFHSDELKKEWDGLIVCHDCWEPRHPQDFVRVPSEETAPPWTRPEPPDVFAPICYIDGSSSYAGMGVAGCMIAGNNTYSSEYLYDIFGPYSHGIARPNFQDPAYVEDDYWDPDYA